MNFKEEVIELENNPMGIYKKVHIKQEPVDLANEEQTAKVDLYANHEIKEEMVIGPVVLQLPNVAQATCGQSTLNSQLASAHRQLPSHSRSTHPNKYHLGLHHPLCSHSRKIF
ncbi:uncharacterized protein LOC113227826 isoform X2 [Hyposmocoma kahamanoa]|uniref:uncharacterized protein LOC113227826 isoform X2 n=1 Tax=Hyposmocoma kahamanoa TaxID=1477025 RepID=UPI000E6D5D5C|nr:uncharacterized protein LOC113227826 isoform X2 [Hyposmocoma kahamanoa]